MLDKVFLFKKFIVNQKDLDDFTTENSLGMVVMDLMNIDQLDRLPFWNAYKEIVAGAIANRHTAITNDLKKVVMSKYRMNDMIIGESDSHYFLFRFGQGSRLTTRQ